MATPKRHDVTCPSCSHSQREYVEATSTFCHACGSHYSLKTAAPRRMTKSAKTASKLNRRRIHCMQCSHPIQVPDASDSWQCPVCSEYLDLKDHYITGSIGRSLRTYGDITIESQGFFSGNRADAKNVRIAGGNVSGQVIARERLEITKPSRVNADLKSETFHVLAGASMESRKSLRCQDAVIEGVVRFREVHISGTLVIRPGGKMRTEELHAPAIKVENGGVLIATHATSPPATALTATSTPPAPTPEQPAAPATTR